MEDACKQIVDALVKNVLKLEQRAVEISAGQVCTIDEVNQLINTTLSVHLITKGQYDSMDNQFPSRRI